MSIGNVEDVETWESGNLESSANPFTDCLKCEEIFYVMCICVSMCQVLWTKSSSLDRLLIRLVRLISGCAGSVSVTVVSFSDWAIARCRDASHASLVSNRS